MTARRRDALIVAAVGLFARLAVVVWAAGIIPPAADGTYYDTLARRIAEGHGYTWLWPDGAVTHAAHYPVGYPALVALGYFVFGAKPVVAFVINALVGTVAGVATWSLTSRASSRGLALAAGLVVALHPALVAYTPALMTEGVTTALVVSGAALAAEASRSRTPWRWLLGTGLVMGLATLVRPQSLALAPLFGALAALPNAERGWGKTIASGALALALSLAVCLPWTLRNCARMERCALVSVNGGWNLAIGAQTKAGGWQEIAVPDACREVFQEAAKDTCFGREAKKEILARPGAWLARIPAKLRMTFDYFGAAPWYLHTANAERFPERAKVFLGAFETLVSRLLLAAALVTILRIPGRSLAAWTRRAIAAVGLAACVFVPGAIAYVALAVAIGALGPRALVRGPFIVPAAAGALLATAAVHAVFFGAGRYGLVVIPFVTALAFVRVKGDASTLAESRGPDHAGRVGAVQAIVGLGASREVNRDGRKVRAPKSTMPGNARWR